MLFVAQARGLRYLLTNHVKTTHQSVLSTPGKILLRSSTIHSHSHVSFLSLKDKDVSVTPLLASANNVWDVAILLVGLPARVDARAPIGGIHPHHGCIEIKHGSL